MDWLLQLSEAEEIKLRQELAEQKPEIVMPFVTSFERYARLEGRQEGLAQGLEQGLERGREEGLRQAIREVLLARFNQIPEPMADALEACSDRDRLRMWLRLASSRQSLTEVALELGIVG